MSENYNEIIAALLERVSVLERELAETRKLLAEKDAVIAAQSARIKELEERLGKNSQNSSKPPSSDGYRKARPVSNREKTGRKAGAQAGHHGHGLKMPKPDVIEDVAHLPEGCVGCPHFGTCPKVATSSVRNEIDVEIKTVLKRHYTESYACAKEAGKVVSGSFPEGIQSSMQYGAGVKALAATLNTEGMMSVARVHDFLSSALNLPVCTGTVSAMVKELAFRLGGTVQAIVRALMASPVNNADFASKASSIGSIPSVTRILRIWRFRKSAARKECGRLDSSPNIKASSSATVWGLTGSSTTFPTPFATPISCGS